ncbi:MAG: membrane carboxypeptidase/penicillin-binding protein, partial [Verrucomicrobiales bacterium]
RLPVTIDQVPKELIRALIAAEDSRFFEHHGVDWIGVARAIFLNFKAGRRTQGASTITQQLGRQSFDLLEKSYGRKITEAFLAHRIEKNFSKEQILEHYLNRIFFGHGFHGVNAAAKGYFGKHVSDVTIEEAAMLCGLIKAPNIYSPLRNRERAKGARDLVLGRMATEGFLTPEDAERLKKRPVTTTTLTSISRSSHAFHYIREQITQKLGEKKAAKGGFRVFTTLDLYLQQRAERSLREHLEETDAREGYPHQTYAQYLQILKQAAAKKQKAPVPKYLQGALIAVDNDDGGIISLIGGRNFQHFQFNCATQAKRPAGSAFKPFVFALAFQNAMFPGSIVTDKVIDNKFVQIGGSDGLLGEWAVETPDYSYLGDITARKALVLSKNAATVRLGLRVGLESFLEFVKEIGIESEMRAYNSSFLGSSEVSLAEMCKAFTVFPNGGLRPQELYIIREIQAMDGTPLYTSEAPEADLVDALDEIAAFQTHGCLQEVLTNGTASRASQLGLQSFPAIAGKTGTAYDFTDTWFLGYDSAITCGVWTGFINPKTIFPGAFSNEIALPIWVDYMNASTRTFKPEPILPPENGKMIEICTVSGELATDACYESHQVPGASTYYERTAVLEFIPTDFHLAGTCSVHSPNSALEALRLETQSILQSGPLDLYRGGDGPKPVLLRESTIIGLDPYGSVHPATRSMMPKEEETPDEDTLVTKATVIKEAPLVNEKVHVQLELPAPIEFID